MRVLREEDRNGFSKIKIKIGYLKNREEKTTKLLDSSGEGNKMCDITKAQLEARISEAVIKFEKEYMGRGPMESKTYILKDMILIRLKGV